jgi:hypothetical protein
MKAPSYVSYNMSKYKAAQRLSNELTRDAQELLVEPGPLMHKPLKVRQHLPKVRRDNLRAQLLQLGTNQSVATLALQYMSFLPRTSDADAQGVQAIIKGLQRHFGLPATGYLDAKTGAYIRRVCGPNWFDMNWASIMSHVLASPRGPQPAPRGFAGLGDDFLEMPEVDVRTSIDTEGEFIGPTFDLPDSPFKGKKPATFTDFLKTPKGLAVVGVVGFVLYKVTR